MRTPFANKGKNNIISLRHAITSNALIACCLGAKSKPPNISLIKCYYYVSLQYPSQDSSVGSISAWSRQGREFFNENKKAVHSLEVTMKHVRT